MRANFKSSGDGGGGGCFTAGQQISGGPPLKCPRCYSTNTKFCYYNNYSLSQPRHFCKACKRYWTRGGTLRNVPVGGGGRKNKRPNKPNPPAAAAKIRLPNIVPPPPANSNGFFFPGFDLDLQLVGQEDLFKSWISSHLPDLRQPSSVGIYSLLSSQMNTSSSPATTAAADQSYLPWTSYDDFPAMSVGNDQNPLDGLSSFLSSDAIVSSTHLQARSGYASIDSFPLVFSCFSHSDLDFREDQKGEKGLHREIMSDLFAPRGTLIHPLCLLDYMMN